MPTIIFSYISTRYPFLAIYKYLYRAITSSLWCTKELTTAPKQRSRPPDDERLGVGTTHLSPQTVSKLLTHINQFDRTIGQHLGNLPFWLIQEEDNQTCHNRTTDRYDREECYGIGE